MNKWLSLAAVVILCLGLVIGIACGGEEEEEAGVKTLKLGWGTPMAGGSGAVIGRPMSWLLKMMAEKIGVFEVGGESYRWKTITEENLLSVAGGHASQSKLIYEHDVDINCQAGPDAGWAAAMLTEELGRPLCIGAGNPWDLSPEYPHTFTSCAMAAGVFPPFFDWLTKEHPEVEVVVGTCTEDALGQAQCDAWDLTCEYHGLEVHRETTAAVTVEYYPVATKLMTHDPDLVVGGIDLFKAMWDMGYEGLCVTTSWVETAHGTVPWDEASGHVLAIMPTSFGDIWPEVTAFAAEYEDRFGCELFAPLLWVAVIVEFWTEMYQIAGSVDPDKFLEVMENGVHLHNNMLGRGNNYYEDTGIFFGLEELNGIGHAGVWPCPIYEIVGPGEYRVPKVYNSDEVEEIVLEVYLAMGKGYQGER